jgi:SAM-dependent methyltransferase
MEPIRINVGAGATPLPGYTNIDRKTGQEAYPLAFPDESVDEVRASHVLEHFGHHEVLKVLADWVRVLRPGGVLKVAVPDFRTIAEGYLARVPDMWQAYAMGGQLDANDYHGSLFDSDILYDCLERSGLIDIEPWVSDAVDCAAKPISLNLMGRKPVRRKLKVACAMSVPRLGFMSNFFAWADALQPLGIVPVALEGAFWGQCLERVMATQAAAGADWILTVDYDSFFTREHIEQLLLTADNHPEADAIVPVQMKRSNEGTPLMTMAGPDGKPLGRVPMETFDRPLTKIATGHFGCTLIRVDKLRSLPHPWFKGEPNDKGQWEEGRVDDDIYFWRKWAEAGNSAYLANRVVIGHGEYLVMLPDENFRMIYQLPGDWRKHGPPANVRR